jgi:hypothetical protein
LAGKPLARLENSVIDLAGIESGMGHFSGERRIIRNSRI